MPHEVDISYQTLDSFTVFGELLKYLRLREQITQRDLSIAVGYSEAQINRLEKNARLPDVGVVIARLIPALNLTADSDAALRLIELAAVARAEPVPVEIQRRRSTHPAGIALRSKPVTNLPAALTSFVGRAQECDEIKRLIHEHRLLTLIGAGGIGKTRLALEVAHGLSRVFVDGIWFVGMAKVRSPRLVPHTAAITFGLMARPGQTPQDHVAEYLKPKSALLIIDNCEHLIDACAELIELLLQQCPHLHILATSREGLQIPGEKVYRIPSLSVHRKAKQAEADERVSDDASTLFVERARIADTRFALDEETMQCVNNICRHLDGIPLAIELTASLLRTMTVKEIDAQLTHHLILDTSGHRTIPRHHTMRLALEWSYNLLTAEEQVLFKRLSVFRGGWSADMAASICEVPFGSLVGLVNKSLVVAEPRGDGTHYRFLEPVRQFAADKLHDMGEGESHRRYDAHMRAFLTLAKTAEPQMRGKFQKRWLDHLERDYDNLRAALEWSLSASGDIAHALGLCSALWQFWVMRISPDEGRHWLDLALGRANLQTPSPEGAGALLGAGVLAWEKSAYDEARIHLHQALAMFETLGDRSNEACTLFFLGRTDYLQARDESAVTFWDQALNLFSQLNDAWGISMTQCWYGHMLGSRGQTEQAKLRLETALTLAQQKELPYEAAVWVAYGHHYLRLDADKAAAVCQHAYTLCQYLGDRPMMLQALWAWGDALSRIGDYLQAETLLIEAKALSHEIGIEYAYRFTTECLSRVEIRLGHFALAEVLLVENLLAYQQTQQPWGVPAQLQGLADVACATGNTLRGVRLYGAAEALCKAVNREFDLAASQAYVSVVHDQLGETAFMAAWDEGFSMPTEQAIAYGLGHDEPS